MLGVGLMILPAGIARFWSRDITERKQTADRIEQLATRDALTGLPNRALAFEYGQHLIASSKRADAGMSLLFIDLDRFKPINDTYGHPAGDEVLRRLRQVPPHPAPGDVLAPAG